MADKKKIFNRNHQSQQLYNSIRFQLRNKYYNLYMSNIDFEGDDVDYRQNNFIKRKLWSDGKIACFKLRGPVGLSGFAQFEEASYDMYDQPEKVQLIDIHSTGLVPSKLQVVDKDCVIGYLQSSHIGLSSTVDYYVDRIAQVEMVINTNLQLHKMPFIIPVDDPDSAKKVQDVLDRLLNNELVLFVDGVDPTLFKAVATGADYIIDKLCNYKKELENELKTILGINNPGVQKIEQLQLSEVNANNDEIMDHDEDYKNNLTEWCDRIKEVLGFDVRVKVKENNIEVAGEVHVNEEKPGPKESEIE